MKQLLAGRQHAASEDRSVMLELQQSADFQEALEVSLNSCLLPERTEHGEAERDKVIW